QEIVDANNQLVEEEAASCHLLLDKLRKTSDSTVSATINQLEAEANADTIILCARKLLTRSLFPQTEQLLKHAIDTYDHLKLTSHQRAADLKLLLAETLLLEQKLTEVRPLLLQALTIRQQAGDQDNPEVVKKLVKAYLKL